MIMRCLTLQAAVAAALCSIGGADAFSSFTLQPSQKFENAMRSAAQIMSIQWNEDGIGIDESEEQGSRREFFSKVATAAAAPILLTSTQASAVTNEPTRIELMVDTEYLIRVLNYFDGDMRKVLGVVVRSPQTTVEIDPPAKGKDPNLTPEDAILRALYSYTSPEDYMTQASWLKIDMPKKSWIKGGIHFLTKKRYTISLPSVRSKDGDEENGQKLEVTIRPTNLDLSNLEAGVALGAISYPLAYSYYQYESYQEEQAAIAKKAKMAAKRAAKAAAAKKSKGTAKKEKKEVNVDSVSKKKKATMKGQEKKKGGGGNKPLPAKKVAAAKEAEIVRELIDSVEDKVAAEMLNSQREKFIETVAKNAQVATAAAEMLDSQRENFIAATTEKNQQDNATVEKPETQPNELEQYVAAAAAAAAAESGSATAVGSIDNILSDGDSGTNSSGEGLEDFQPTEANLRALVENGKPKKGPFNNYLDSL